MRKQSKVEETRDAALVVVGERGRRGVVPSHERVRGALAPVEVQLDMLRLRLHTATASADPTESGGMADAARLCDDAREHLDAARRLIRAAAVAAGIEAAA